MYNYKKIIEITIDNGNYNVSIDCTSAEFIATIYTLYIYGFKNNLITFDDFNAINKIFKESYKINKKNML